MAFNKTHLARIFMIFVFNFAFGAAQIVAAQISIEKKLIHLDKPVEILLLQDESGSMTSGGNPSDPKGLRQHAANYLIDQLRIAGAKNEMGFLSFPTYPALEVPIGKAFDRILDNARQGRPEKTSEQLQPATCYKKLEAVPFYMYTDGPHGFLF